MSVWRVDVDGYTWYNTVCVDCDEIMTLNSIQEFHRNFNDQEEFNCNRCIQTRKSPRARAKYRAYIKRRDGE